MTAAGWHPDPHGRADRRYHDGSGWTEHITDAAGTTSVDELGPGPAPGAPVPVADAAPPGLVIGPPPPRRAAAPTPPPPEDATQVLRPADLDLDGPTGPVAPAPGPDRAAASAALEPESTDVMPGARRDPAPVDATQVTRIPADLAAGGAGLAAPGPRTPPGGSVAVARPMADRAGTSPGGVVLAVVGVGVGLGSLLVLPWAEGGGREASFTDLRDVVVDTGPAIGIAPTSVLLTGAVFALAAGGVVAVARALGMAAVRILAAVLVVGGAVALSLVGLSAADAAAGDDAVDVTTTAPAVPGDTVVDEGGAAVTDPETGALVTVPEVDPTEALDQATPADAAEGRLRDAATLGAALMGAVTFLAVVGLLVRGTAGHVVAAAGLGVALLWVGAGVGGLATDDQVGGLGLGAYGFVVAAIALAVAAALPASSRRG